MIEISIIHFPFQLLSLTTEPIAFTIQFFLSLRFFQTFHFKLMNFFLMLKFSLFALSFFLTTKLLFLFFPFGFPSSIIKRQKS